MKKLTGCSLTAAGPSPPDHWRRRRETFTHIYQNNVLWQLRRSRGGLHAGRYIEAHVPCWVVSRKHSHTDSMLTWNIQCTTWYISKVVLPLPAGMPSSVPLKTRPFLTQCVNLALWPSLVPMQAKLLGCAGYVMPVEWNAASSVHVAWILKHEHQNLTFTTIKYDYAPGAPKDYTVSK